MKKRILQKKRKGSAEKQLDQVKDLYLSGLSLPIVSMLVGAILFPQEAAAFLEVQS